MGPKDSSVSEGVRLNYDGELVHPGMRNVNLYSVTLLEKRNNSQFTAVQEKEEAVPR